MVMIIRRHALLLLLASHSAVGHPAADAHTTVKPSGPALNRSQPVANGSCQASCVYTVPSVSYNWWDPVSITETVTAETIVTVINRKKNTTSFSTISNPSWDPSKHPKPTDLNSDGTRTAVITDMAPFGSSSTTYTITFPTMYLSYPPIYTVSGQIPTTIDGKSTCATFTGYEGAVLTWPSHPTIAPTAPILNADRFEQDPRGWSWVFKQRDTFAIDVYSNASLPDEDRHPGEWWVRPFFPDLPLWDCSAGVYNNNPYAVAAKTALFLTGSSTAFEDGDDHDHDEEKTSSTGSLASNVAPKSTASASVAAAPLLILSSSTSPGAGAKTSLFAIPANTAIDRLPLQTLQASQTARDSPAKSAKGTAASLPEGENIGKQGGSIGNAADHSLLVPNPDVNDQPTPTTSEEAATIATSPNVQAFSTNPISQVVSDGTHKISGPSASNVEPMVVTPLVIPPGSQSVVLSLSGSETTLAVQTSGPLRSFQFAGQTMVVDSQGQYRVGGQTLSPNQAVTVAGASTDVGKGGGGGSMPQNTNAGRSGGSGSASMTAPAALIVGSQTIQPNAKGEYILQSQTLATDTAGRLVVGGATLGPGSAFTVSGIPNSLSSQTIAAISETSAQTGLGLAIMSGFGPGAPSSLSNASVSGTGSGGPVAPVAFTSDASRDLKGMLYELAMLGFAVLGLVQVV